MVDSKDYFPPKCTAVKTVKENNLTFLVPLYQNERCHILGERNIYA
jgi:hypothetical protein